MNASPIKITTAEFFKMFKFIGTETSVLLYIKNAMKALAENSWGDIVWVSRRNGKEVHREKANYKKPKVFKNFYKSIEL